MNDSPQGEPPETLDPERGANGAAPADPDGEAASGEAADLGEPDGLREELAALRQEAAAVKDLARRAQADLANVRRRASEERAEFRSRALAEVSGGLLPVLDDLHRAVGEAAKATARQAGDGDGAEGEESAESPADSVVQGLHEGVRLVLRRFQDTLRRQGVVEIEADGALFDPRLHEAVHEAPAAEGQRDGEVVEVLRRGYRLDGRVIRPATVIVASGNAAPPPEAADAGEDAGGGDPEPEPPQPA